MHVFAGFDSQLHRIMYELIQFTIDPGVNLEKICSVLNLKIKKYIFYFAVLLLLLFDYLGFFLQTTVRITTTQLSSCTFGEST